MSSRGITHYSAHTILCLGEYSLRRNDNGNGLVFARFTVVRSTSSSNRLKSECLCMNPQESHVVSKSDQ